MKTTATATNAFLQPTPNHSITNGQPTNGMRAQKVPLPNKLLAEEKEDVLYHFGISKSDKHVVSRFAAIKFVCTGGSALRIRKYAEMFSKQYDVPMSENLSVTDRYAMYITGSILWINHGMGVPSLSIMLIEVIKLLHYANATDVRFIRMGTSGGVGVPPGTVVVSNGALNGLMEQKHILYVNGKQVEYDAILNAAFSDELYAMAQQLNMPVEHGLTFCADDFYEGQMRLNGLFCDYTHEDKTQFLKTLHDHGVRNIEMESVGFAAYTHRVQMPAAIICVAIVNRMEMDQMTLPKSDYHEMETRPFRVVCAYIDKVLKLKPPPQ